MRARADRRSASTSCSRNAPSVRHRRFRVVAALARRSIKVCADDPSTRRSGSRRETARPPSRPGSPREARHRGRQRRVRGAERCGSASRRSRPARGRQKGRRVARRPIDNRTGPRRRKRGGGVPFREGRSDRDPNVRSRLMIVNIRHTPQRPRSRAGISARSGLCACARFAAPIAHGRAPSVLPSFVRAETRALSA